MADPAFRQSQWEQRYSEHMAPVNQYVDELRTHGRGWAPYVAPIHGGVEARVLSILRDPGPATQDGTGSGFICTENDDGSAALQAELLAAVGLSPFDLLPWNAYPWYINRAPTGEQLDAGVETILHLLDHLPRLQVILLQGGDAQKAWRRVLRRRPTIVRERSLSTIQTYHPSPQALWSPVPEERERRIARRRDSFRELAVQLARQKAR